MYVCIEDKPVNLTNDTNWCIKFCKFKSSSSNSDVNPKTAISSEQ
jgi:hypothetical protein